MDYKRYDDYNVKFVKRHLYLAYRPKSNGLDRKIISTTRLNVLKVLHKNYYADDKISEILHEYNESNKIPFFYIMKKNVNFINYELVESNIVRDNYIVGRNTNGKLLYATSSNLWDSDISVKDTIRVNRGYNSDIFSRYKISSYYDVIAKTDGGDVNIFHPTDDLNLFY